MSNGYENFQRFASELRTSNDDTKLELGTEDGYSVYYVPFEHLNTEVRLVLVGITPGPKQMKCAYAEARKVLTSSTSTADGLRQIKKECAFCGMRAKINEMLDYFGIPKCVGAGSAESLWTEKFDLFHPTSVIPNAAFRNGAYFNGPFSAISDTPLLRRQFEELFVQSVKRINKNALYIGMGPVVDKALDWCVEKRVLDKRKVLGCFPHASGASGSQFAYFMRKIRLADLHPRDPVRYRVRDLDAAYERIVRTSKRYVQRAECRLTAARRTTRCKGGAHKRPLRAVLPHGATGTPFSAKRTGRGTSG